MTPFDWLALASVSFLLLSAWALCTAPDRRLDAVIDAVGWGHDIVTLVVVLSLVTATVLALAGILGSAT